MAWFESPVESLASMGFGSECIGYIHSYVDSQHKT